MTISTCVFSSRSGHHGRHGHDALHLDRTRAQGRDLHGPAEGGMSSVIVAETGTDRIARSNATALQRPRRAVREPGVSQNLLRARSSEPAGPEELHARKRRTTIPLSRFVLRFAVMVTWDSCSADSGLLTRHYVLGKQARHRTCASKDVVAPPARRFKRTRFFPPNGNPGPRTPADPAGPRSTFPRHPAGDRPHPRRGAPCTSSTAYVPSPSRTPPAPLCTAHSATHGRRAAMPPDARDRPDVVPYVAQ